MLEKLAIEIGHCLLLDQFRLKKQLVQLLRLPADSEKYARELQTLNNRVQESSGRVAQRRSSIPPLTFPEQLPISEKRELIAKTLAAHQVIVLAGETGSGKTTQIPKICLELGLGTRGLIGHTQPRRIAARSVAARISDELRVQLGREVGYQVRFSDITEPGTLIKLMTDGILLAEIQQDRYLNKYEVLIIDEAHERSLNIDFLLGYLRELLPKRPDLKLIITSATIDVEKFSQHFGNAPVISIAGRTFPVDIHYRPAIEGNCEDEKDCDPLIASIVSTLAEIEQLERTGRQRPGDVLVFLSGEREIRDLALELRKHPLQDTEILPLYARLSPAEQSRIFSSHPGRRIVLSTNVAETSLTVPGIVYVIDTGYARISRYSVQSKVQRLPVERISQASANQRAGRCGRVSNGNCYRLYSEEDFINRPQFTDPEIQRTNLSAVILQMLILGLGDIASFPFVEKPEVKAINDGFKLLHELGAIDKERQLTPIGRRMAAIPADPRLARMLIEADLRKCLYEMLIIVSALSVQDPREFPPDKKQAAREKHDQFAHPDSDFLSWVLLWTEYETQRQTLSQSELRQYCRKSFLSLMRMREWRETHRQLHLACQRSGMLENHGTSVSFNVHNINYEAIHRAIVRGSLNQLGMKTEDGQYLGSRGRKFTMFPTSCLFRRQPKWIVTGELIETSRLYATLAAKIQPEWAVDAAQHLLKRDYSEAHWEKNRGQVVAYEKLTLFGLVLVERQAVTYSNIDPVQSRDIFIREALVSNNLNTKAAFYQHNLSLQEALRREEEKQRRPDIIASEDQIYEFYASRIPVGICDTRSFENWLKSTMLEDTSVLHMTQADLLQRDLDESAKTDYPDHTTIQNNVLDIEYRFNPGSTDDGASISVPLRIVGQMTDAELDWAVPGQIRERCIVLLKGLPKGQRKHFIPVPDFADTFVSWLKSTPADKVSKSPLIDLLRKFVHNRKGIELDRATLQQIELPVYLRPTLRVIDDEGREVEHSQSLAELQQRYGRSPITKATTESLHPMEKEQLTGWDFGELPASVTFDVGVRITRYPALVDQGDSVSLLLQDDPQVAAMLSRKGLARLFMLRTVQQRNTMLKRLRQLEKQLALKVPNTAIDFGEESLLAIYQIAFKLDSITLPHNKDEFEQQLTAGKSALLSTGEDFEKLLVLIVEGFFAIRKRLQRLQGAALKTVIQDINEQIQALVYQKYISETPPQWLMEYPRYFKAIELRLDKLPHQLSRDQENTRILNGLQMISNEIVKSANPNSKAISELRWHLEELRVSLFAQTLKTKVLVSEKRLKKMLDELRKA
ncbi:MAG: ATP-dependent RNA helicase HrpA [Gammaproteobacteria bacterium]|nr:ATP-dependent RNA helicase HrpA [Gammaproteobacteria bacterium]